MAIRNLSIEQHRTNGYDGREYWGTVYGNEWTKQIEGAWAGAYTPPADVRIVDEVRYAGAVLASYNQTDRVMSDVWETALYAKVWDAAEQKVKAVCVGYYYGSCHKFEAVVDATPEAIAAAAAWEAAEQARERAERQAGEGGSRPEGAPGNARRVLLGRHRQLRQGQAGNSDQRPEGERPVG